MWIELLGRDCSVEVVRHEEVDAQCRLDSQGYGRRAHSRRAGANRSCRRAAGLVDGVRAYGVGVVVGDVEIETAWVNRNRDRVEAGAERSVDHRNQSASRLNDVSDQLVRSPVGDVNEVALGIFGDRAGRNAGGEALGNRGAAGNRRSDCGSWNRGECARSWIPRESEDGRAWRGFLIDDVDEVVEAVGDDRDRVISDVLVQRRRESCCLS